MGLPEIFRHREKPAKHAPSVEEIAENYKRLLSNNPEDFALQEETKARIKATEERLGQGLQPITDPNIRFTTVR